MPDNTTNKLLPEYPEVKWVVARFNESKNYYRPLIDKFEDWDKQYFSIPGETRYKWQSNVFVPATYKAVKTLLARIIAALFATPIPFDVVGVEERDRPGEIPIKNLVSYQFEKTNIFNKFVVFVLQALIRGTSVGKVFWTKDYTYVPRTVEYDEEVLVAVDEEGKPLKKGKTRKVIQKKEKTIYDQKILYEGPDFQVLDIAGGIFPDPYATDFKDSYIIHKTIRTADYLKRYKDKYENIDLALTTEYPGDDEWQHSRLEGIGLTEPQEKLSAEKGTTESKTEEGLDKYEILEYHGKYDINDDGFLEDSIITICNRSVLLKKRVNHYPDGCFVKIGFMPVLDEFFWQGVCELVEQLQEELNDKRNQRLDNVNLVLQKILAYVEDAVDTKVIKNFVFAPGARLPVKDINAIQWVEVPDVTQSSYNEERILMQDIQETSGAVNVLMPTSNQADIHRTASGLFMLKGEAETSIKLIVQLIESMGLKEIAQKYHNLNKIFMTRPLTIRILGTRGFEYPVISPEDIRWYNCDFIFKGASAYVNREIRLAQLTKLMDIFSKIPNLFMQFDAQKIGKMISNILGFEERELMAEQRINPLLQQAGLTPQLNPSGLGGQPAQTGLEGNDALQNMVSQGLPLEQIAGQIEKLQQ